jgi:Mrp family chromosome partitioning ATPase
VSRIFEVSNQAEVETDKPANIQSRSHAGRLVAKGVLISEGGDLYDEEISRLVQTVFLSGSPRTPRRLVFCGVDDAEGSALMCASAGRALAARNESACVVDAHVRASRLSKLLGVDDDDLLFHKELPTHDRCIRVANQLWMAGTNMVRDESGSLIPVADLKLLLSRLQAMYGTVLIDAPGTSSSRDAALLGQLADAAILVVEANSTRKMAARKAKEFLERAGVQLIGTILNNRTFPIPEALYKIL